MRRLRSLTFIFVILAALLVLPGCWVMSVYPLYEDDDLQVADPGLAGQWWQPEGDCRLSLTVGPTFSGQQEFALEYSAPEKGAERADNACVIEDGEGPVKLRGRLLDLEGHLFLDLLPRDTEGSFQVMPVHSIFRITVRNDELDIVPLNADFVERAIRHDAIAGMTDGPIVTARTSEWRKFVLGAVDDVSAFTEVKNDHRTWHFTRLPAGVAPSRAPQKPACQE